MTNFEYYRTPQELKKGFKKFCHQQESCYKCKYFTGSADVFCSHLFAYDEHEEELKPCPFCGGRPFITDTNCENRWYKGYRVSCEKCRVTTPQGERDKVIKMWNERTYENEPAPQRVMRMCDERYDVCPDGGCLNCELCKVKETNED